MKILIISDDPMQDSGYSTQAKTLADYLYQKGHDVTYYGYTYTGLPHRHFGYLVVGSDNKLDLTRHWAQDKDLVLTMKDITSYNTKTLTEFNWVALAPIDAEPVPMIMHEALQKAPAVIALTDTARSQLADLKLEQSKIKTLPHCIDTKWWAQEPLPTNPYDLPKDAFVVSLVANNNDPYDRKNLMITIQAWSMFCNHLKTDYGVVGVMLLHSNPKGEIRFQGPLQVQSAATSHFRLTYTPQTPATDVRAIYHESAYLLSLGNEGFNLPRLEAAAAGVPSITVEWAAGREDFPGFKLPSDKPVYWDEDRAYIQSYWGEPHIIPSRLALWYRPSISGIVDTLHTAFQAWKDPDHYADLESQCYDKVQQYDKATILPLWENYLQELVEKWQ